MTRFFPGIIEGIKAWLDPAPDAIVGKTTEVEREQCFHIAFLVYASSFAVIRQFYKFVGNTITGSEYAPTFALLLALAAYVILFLYRLGQGVSSASSRPRILLVEDDKTFVSIIIRILRDGWDIYSVGTVEEALSRIRDSYAFVLLDLTLPDGGGELILRKIRREQLSCKVIVLTGLSAGPTYEEVKSLKPDFLLQKPINAEALLKTLREHSGNT